jgi:hypothetical protein
LRFFDAFSVLQFEVILDCEKGTAILRRNDGWKAIYRREEWQHKDHFHIICDSKGTVRQTALLRTDITPLELIIKRDLPDGIVCERYIRQEICPGP